MSSSTMEKEKPVKGQLWEGEKYFTVLTWGELSGQTPHAVDKYFGNAQVDAPGMVPFPQTTQSPTGKQPTEGYTAPAGPREDA